MFFAALIFLLVMPSVAEAACAPVAGGLTNILVLSLSLISIFAIIYAVLKARANFKRDENLSFVACMASIGIPLAVILACFSATIFVLSPVTPFSPDGSAVSCDAEKSPSP